MSSESYCLGYVSWSHDMIVLDLMSMPLLTCDLGESHAISCNLVMDEMCLHPLSVNSMVVSSTLL